MKMRISSEAGSSQGSLFMISQKVLRCISWMYIFLNNFCKAALWHWLCDKLNWNSVYTAGRKSRNKDSDQRSEDNPAQVEKKRKTEKNRNCWGELFPWDQVLWVSVFPCVCFHMCVILPMQGMLKHINIGFLTLIEINWSCDAAAFPPGHSHRFTELSSSDEHYYK